MDITISWEQMTKTQKLEIYTDNRAVPFNREAIFSDGSEDYRYPMDPKTGDNLRLRIRTGKNNVDCVRLMCNGEAYPMSLEYSDELFDYFTTTIVTGSEGFTYYYDIVMGDAVFYYNRKGVSMQREEYYDFHVMPNFETPDWAKGAVFYQIYVDRFCNGDRSNDVVDREYAYIREPVRQVRDWNRYPSAMDVQYFYGGDLQGVWKKLDYLQDLGVEVIYLNPIFVSPSNHKYDIQDYDYVDPHFGVIVKDGGDPLADGDLDNSHATKYITRVADKANLEASNDYFARFVAEVHRRGMKIILDGVFNHCGSFNKWLDRERLYESQPGYEKGAYVEESSPYHDFFKFYEKKWPYNGAYDGWWGHDTLPKLNYEESPKLYEYILRIASKWVSPPYNVDGWRLDVAADLGYSNEFNHKFWKDFRRVVKEANPEALILAEHYGSPTDWLQGDEWDTVMNYDAFMEPITWFLTGMEKHSDSYHQDLLGNPDAFMDSMQANMVKLSTQSQLVAMNELSNHDHSRFLTRTNHIAGRTATHGPQAANEGVNPAMMRAAVVMQMTWIGAPTIYYGDEAGMCGWTDPDNRRAFPWGKEDKEMIQFHKEAIRIHKDYQALRTGSWMSLYTRPFVLCYARFDSKDRLVVAINSSDREVTIRIPVWRVGFVDGSRLGRMIVSGAQGYDLCVQMIEVNRGEAAITLPPFGSAIYKNMDSF